MSTSKKAIDIEKLSEAAKNRQALAPEASRDGMRGVGGTERTDGCHGEYRGSKIGFSPSFGAALRMHPTGKVVSEGKERLMSNSNPLQHSLSRS